MTIRQYCEWMLNGMTNSTDLINLTISEAGSALRNGETSAVALTEATLARIKQTEPTVNAYATVPEELALKAAQRADVALASGNDHGPLHGIPIGVKDICYTKGILTEAGSKVMEGFVPDFDSTVVQKLYAAGAIMIGKTRCHEFAYGVNEPPTRSPWELNMLSGRQQHGLRRRADGALRLWDDRHRYRAVQSAFRRPSTMSWA